MLARDLISARHLTPVVSESGMQVLQVAVALVISVAYLTTCVCVAEEVPLRKHLGVDCNEKTPCKALNENCKDGYCKCEAGYIRNEHHCFPERNYGETCFFDIQCIVHPMICSDAGNGVKRCDCHRFYNWSMEAKSCMLADNVTSMISALEEKTFSAERIAMEAAHIFPGVVAAGILVLVLGAVLASGCVTYGCFWGRCSSPCRKPPREANSKLVEVNVAGGTSATNP